MKDNYRCVTNQGQTGRVSLRTNFSKVENHTQQVFHTIHKMYETLKKSHYLHFYGIQHVAHHPPFNCTISLFSVGSES